MQTPYMECAACGWQGGLLAAICPRCGGDWFEVRYDYPAVRRIWDEQLALRPFTMWRYHELLPLRDGTHRITMGEGGTPLLHAKNLGMMLGLPHIYIKDERQGPTGSFKDRQASLAMSVMKEAGITEAVVASTGNVAISYSAYSALAGIKLWAFLNSSVPVDKMREVALYGTDVVKVTATYDQAKKVAAEFAQRRQLYLDRGIKNIAARESMKTLSFEIAEQLAEILGSGERTPWLAPDWYFQSVSGGLGPIGVWKGFQELVEMGLVERLPKLACIQAEGCAPMVLSFQKGLEEAEPVLNPTTLIATVATGIPGAAYSYLRRVILEHGGNFEMVSDEEAFRAMQVMAKMDGISMEPAAAMAFAGLFKLVSKGVIGRDDVVIVNCSGHTFPVEKFILGDNWAQSMELAAAGTPAAQEEGLLTSLEHLDRRVQRVAIIEDNPEASLLLRRVLQAQGEFLVSEAHDGQSGLEMMRAEPPDLVLLDLMMPGLDGFGVIEELKKDERLKDVPVIVVTARDLTVHERRRLDGHVRGLLQKGSFLSTDILEDIQKVLGEG